MTIAVDTITATLLEGAGHDLGKVSGSVTMDEGWAPHVQATLVLGVPDEELLDLLDPRDARRVLIEVAQTFPNSFVPDEARSFDLCLRERVIDHEAGTVTLELASDEALLMDYAHVSDTGDASALAYQSSLRDIIDNVVLSEIGAALEPGTTDTPFYVLTSTRNLLNDSGYRGPAETAAIPGWIFSNPGLPSSGAADKRPIASPPEPGVVWSARVTGLSAASANVGIFNQGGETGTPAYVSVTPGETVNARAWVRTSSAVNLRLSVEFMTSSATVAGAIHGATVTTQANVWKLLTAQGTIPANGVRAGLHSYTTGSSPAGMTFELAGAVLTDDGVVPDGFFDGTTTDTELYSYAWTGTTNASSSTRTALIDRSPDLLRWDPGESAWEFIQPLFQAAGFRLYCDEARNWHLVNGSEYIAPGMTQLTFGVHLTRAQDGIRRDSNEWFDAAVVTYRWRDSDAVEQERIDYYAEPGATKARAFVVERPYPGPGFAEYAVKRATGKGRTLRLATMNRFGVTPSQILRVDLPSTLTQLGVVASVSWDLGEAVMSVSSRGLTDVPEGAWALVDPGMTWSETPATTTYNDWINPNGV